jgi:hypothetical protein
MGFLSFLFGGKKTAKAEAASVVAPKPDGVADAPPRVVIEEPGLAAAAPVIAAVTPEAVETGAETGASGVHQVRLRLRLAGALNRGDLSAAYEAAAGLADIQVQAGRRLGARAWREEADRILEAMS